MRPSTASWFLWLPGRDCFDCRCSMREQQANLIVQDAITNSVANVWPDQGHDNGAMFEQIVVECRLLSPLWLSPDLPDITSASTEKRGRGRGLRQICGLGSGELRSRNLGPIMFLHIPPSGLRVRQCQAGTPVSRFGGIILKAPDGDPYPIPRS